MAQVGIHGLLVLPIKKIAPTKKGLLLGIMLGSILPDADNFAVAVATITGGSTAGLHRSYTHSLITAAVVFTILYLLGLALKKESWGDFGLGLGLGIGLHAAVDLLIWFNGVELLWPFNGLVNLWSGFTASEFWMDLMNPLEFLFIALFFMALKAEANKMGTDQGFQSKLQIWTYIQLALFVIFLALMFITSSALVGTIYGAFYLLSLILLISIVIKMRNTIETQSV